MSQKPDIVVLKVEGMDCTNCALGITRSLEKKGFKNVYTNFSTGEVTFESIKSENEIPLAKETIHKLGYTVVSEEKQGRFSVIEKKFAFTLPFTIPLLLHMFLPYGWLHHPIVQLALCLPVYILGFWHFGKSAFNSLKAGVSNMDVLIFIGSNAAFFYSLAGTIIHYGTHEVHNYLFYETTATIITLVLLGNVLEHRSVKTTTNAISELSKLRPEKATKIEGNSIIEISTTEIKQGDLLQINTGDKVAVDGIIVKGNCQVDESMITGESIPVEKKIGDELIGGTVIIEGAVQLRAEKVGRDTMLSQIIELVKNAQQSKPELQKLGDKISAIFVPIVVAISIITFISAFFIFGIELQKALMNSIAVLVISCPCAMGLATPTAVMVGIGRAAKSGILIKGGNTLEILAGIKKVVFDKTGTLTTGNFKIQHIKLYAQFNETEVKSILLSLEKHSSHPIAKSLTHELNLENIQPIELVTVSEKKGLGLMGIDNLGNTYMTGSYKILDNQKEYPKHSIYVTLNNLLIAGIDIEDEIKETAITVINQLKNNLIRPVLLSGDRIEKCVSISQKLGIDEVYAEFSPEQKLTKIESLNNECPTAMVGDGINDAPALAKAAVGISLGNASQVAIQSAQVVILNGNDLEKVNQAILIGKHTLITIKQNLFWAFFYNVIAIPIAAFGFLNPMIGALAMAFSDIVVIGNSIRLRTKKLK
ncbi:MAG: heavy metal translocating P-type ATPase [Bacteroidia bacterium]